MTDAEDAPRLPTLRLFPSDGLPFPNPGKVRVADQPEGGQTSQYKRVYQYQSGGISSGLSAIRPRYGNGPRPICPSSKARAVAE
jgi:hypothetical protein